MNMHAGSPLITVGWGARRCTRLPNPSTPITLCTCSDVPVFLQPSSREAIAHRRADGADLIVQALDHLRGGVQTDGSSHGAPTLARQKEDLREWARSLGLLLKYAKNLVRFEDTLIPFDVIPWRPDGGFPKFIADTLAEGQTLSAVRTVSTSKRML